MSPLNTDELKISLEQEDLFLTELINTIPAKIYFDRDVKEKIMAEKHALMDENIKGLKRGFHSRKEVSAKTKHKRAKLDPQYQKSVSQVQKEISEETSNKKSKKKVTFKPASLTRAENIEELQRRLHEKVNELQAKRRGCSAKEFLEKRQQKKKEKKKLKKTKQKGNFSKEKKTLPPKAENSEHQKLAKGKSDTNKRVYNKEGKVIFSKLEFSESGMEIKGEKAFSGKNYKKLLNNVEKEKEKITNLKEQDAKKADELIRKKSWKRAIAKAEGVKVKDDPALLKKSLVKQEKKKQKSAKVWKQRQDFTENKKKIRQEKRQKNIQNRKKEKLQAKVKRAKKKGRLVPGFS